MNRTRERYNSKARQSSSGSHKKKAKRASKDGAKVEIEQTFDSNADIVAPKPEEQKALERKEKLKQELIAQRESKVSSKKKKRLEKYIDKKLKQEERLILFEKLTKTQAQVPSALSLQSSSTLGTGAAKSHKELLDQQGHREIRHAVTGEGFKRKRQGATYTSGATDESEDDGDIDERMEVDGDEDANSEVGRSPLKPIVVVNSGFATAPAVTSEISVTKTPVVGSALKRDGDGKVVAPTVKKKTKGPKATFASWKVGLKRQPVDPESDSSFDSSDSAYDSDEKEDRNFESEAESDSTRDAHSGQDDDAEESTPENSTPPPPQKRLGFKEWAMKQLSAAKGYVAPVLEPKASSSASDQPFEPAPPPKRRKIDPDARPGIKEGPLGESLSLPDTSFAKQLQESSTRDNAIRKRKVVEVKRPPEVEEARLSLPIVAEEQPIMEAILLHSVVIICGETGSGKTTQVPQFLYEAGFGSPDSDNPGMIGVTQPRRVAAMSMASRVAHELSLTSSKVSYQIRYDATVSPDTSIKFMTDGVLLRELATDFLLAKYSVIIIDEAHERSMNTDILIGVLSRVIKLREQMWLEKKDDIKPLRLIIMSATLRVSDFAENTTLFSTPPPVINVPARQHPVTVHFSRRTPSDYVSGAIRKASKIHVRLPPGGILIFLTGQNEITGVCKKLEAKYGAKALEDKKRKRVHTGRRLDVDGNTLSDNASGLATVASAHADVEAEDVDLGVSKPIDLALDVDSELNAVDLDAEALDSADDESENKDLGIDIEESDVPMYIVPLYALLPSEKQLKVFKPPPPGCRLVVVATNVAETSLTIPGIRYVVDCGRAKERRYDVANGIQSFQVSWISKASAAQRAGRAGRTGPGHCYRLYSSALYENYFEQFSEPEIIRMPIEGVILQMKSMHVDAVINFPFPTPPDRSSLKKAETVLTHLGAVSTSSEIGNGQITEIGRAMSLFPLSPRYSRMLVSGLQHGCLPYVVTIVSALSVGDPFLREESLEVEDEEGEELEAESLAHLTSEAVKAKEVRRLRRKAFFESQMLHASLGNHSSDVFRMLSVVGAYEYAGGGHEFCSDHFVRPKAMEEIHKLRAQISNIVQANFPDANAGFTANLQPPSNLQLKVIRQLLAAAFIDQVAVRKDKISPSAHGQQYTTSKGVPYQAMGIVEDVYIHPSSVLANMPAPDYVVYLEVVRSSCVFIKGITTVNAAWLPTLGKSLCTFSKPIQTKDGESVVIPHFGPNGWELHPIKSPDLQQGQRLNTLHYFTYIT